MADTFRYRGLLCEVWKYHRDRGRWCSGVIGKKDGLYLTQCVYVRDGERVFETDLPRTKAEAIESLKVLIDWYSPSGKIVRQ